MPRYKHHFGYLITESTSRSCSVFNLSFFIFSSVFALSSILKFCVRVFRIYYNIFCRFTIIIRHYFKFSFNTFLLYLLPTLYSAPFSPYIKQRYFPLRKYLCFLLLYYMLSYIFIQRTVSGAGAVVLPFFVHSERVPRGGAINVFLVYVVHTYGDSQHRAHCD